MRTVWHCQLVTSVPIRHPVAVLDWIDGPTLIAAVDRSCRAGDGAHLAALAHAWSQMVWLLARTVSSTATLPPTT